MGAVFTLVSNTNCVCCADRQRYDADLQSNFSMRRTFLWAKWHWLKVKLLYKRELFSEQNYIDLQSNLSTKENFSRNKVNKNYLCAKVLKIYACPFLAHNLTSPENTTCGTFCHRDVPFLRWSNVAFSHVPAVRERNKWLRCYSWWKELSNLRLGNINNTWCI